MNTPNRVFFRWTPTLCLILVWIWWVRWVSEPLPFYPTGVDWTQYIMGAEYLWRWSPEMVYPDWRHPLYSYLLGFGAVESYAQSARIINMVGMVLGGVACMYVGQVIRRPWFAVLTCVIWLFNPLVLDARDWINPYMLWGGTLAIVGACGWRMEKSDSTISTIALLISGSLALWLDGRTLFVLAGVVLWLASHQQWRRLGLILAGWMVTMGLEQVFLGVYDIQLKGLTEQLELQRSFLFRDGMAFQLFPSPDNASTIESVCVDAQLTEAFNWHCALQMGTGNFRVWLEQGLLPPVLLMVFSMMGWLISRRWRALLLLGLLCGPLLLNGLVWSPPRYLFWTLWCWVACLGGSVYALAEHPRFKWFAIPHVLGILWWLWSSPVLTSLDQPKDWPTTGRLVSEQVGEKVLDCTGEGFTLGRLSSRRDTQWRMLPQTGDCRRWMDDGSAMLWGVDTVLSIQAFSPPSGWTLETGFDFKSGIVYMYRAVEPSSDG